MDYLLKQQNQQSEGKEKKREENNEEKQYSTAGQKSTNQQCVDMACGMQSLSSFYAHALPLFLSHKIQANNAKLRKVNLNRN